MGVNENPLSKINIWGFDLLIFVVLGTHELPFSRLLEEVEKQIIAGNIKESVVVQAGHTIYRSQHMDILRFVTYEQMEQLYKQASFIITHGGTGSITMGLKLGKKLIAAPRLMKYGEHNDDHQLEIVSQFEKNGHLLAFYEGDNLADKLKQLSSFSPVPFVSGKKKIIDIIKTFIDEQV